MIEIYAALVRLGKKKLEEIPKLFREDVKKLLHSQKESEENS